MPLYAHHQGHQLVGTALYVDRLPETPKGLREGVLYDAASVIELGENPFDVVVSKLGGEGAIDVAGFVVEGSDTDLIRFECREGSVCKEGMIVWSHLNQQRIYYQVVGGMTQQETAESNRQGMQIAYAVQLGVITPDNGFTKYRWLPRMNALIFRAGQDYGGEIDLKGDFTFGTLPETTIQVKGPLIENLEFHTAILGITGSGKTELALDLLFEAYSQGLKIICVDITSRYLPSLAALNPVEISLPEDLLTDFEELLFEVETGEYKASKEKQKLRAFLRERKEEVAKQLKEFLAETGPGVAVLSLKELSNTVATLELTHLYLDIVFGMAKRETNKFPRLLIAIDEAHTIIPEPTGMDFGIKDLVGKISQIALQGRKYKIGLLLVSQRTATLSKSVLTQCNTVITFSCIDETSLAFLRNVYSQGYVAQVPNLPPLTAIVAGKGAPGGRPILFEVPRKSADKLREKTSS